MAQRRAFEGIGEMLMQVGEQKRKSKLENESQALEAMTKLAALKEQGYNPVRFGGGVQLQQDPSYVGMEQLKRQKLMNELDPNYEAKQAAEKEKAIIGVRQAAMESQDSFGGGSQGAYTEVIDSLGKPHIIKKAEVPPAEVGRDVLAGEALGSVGEARKLLFPGGTPESFDRETAWGANRPFGNLPFLPKVRPDNPLDPTDNTKAMKAQKLQRLLKTGLSSRQLIQTGVAARPEETQALLDAFFPDWMSNPQSAWEGLTQLEDFYKRYRSGLRNRSTDQMFGQTEQVQQDDPLGIL